MMGRTVGLGAVLTFTMMSAVAAAQDQPPPPPPPATTETAPPPPPPATTPETKAGSSVGTSSEWGGLFNGRTLGSGGGGVFVTGGYPGGSAGVLFGIHDKIDIGAIVGPVYNASLETDNFNPNFGLFLRAIGRFQLVSTDSVSFLLRVEPGVQFPNFNPVLWGVALDVAANLGIKVMKGGSVYVGVEVPAFIGVDVFSGFEQIPILGGAGFEYHINDFIGVGARFMGGPSIAIQTTAGVTTTTVAFAMIAEGLFVFRWDRVSSDGACRTPHRSSRRGRSSPGDIASTGASGAEGWAPSTSFGTSTPTNGSR